MPEENKLKHIYKAFIEEAVTMIYIVFGASYVGKSFFIKNNVNRGLPFKGLPILPPDAYMPIGGIGPRKILKNEKIPENTIIEIDLSYWPIDSSKSGNGKVTGEGQTLFNKILTLQSDIFIIVVVSSYDHYLRIKKNFPVACIWPTETKENFTLLYEQLLSQLDAHDKSYIIIKNEVRNFSIISRGDVLKTINKKNKTYSKEDIERLVNRSNLEKFQYGQVSLPWGLKTNGFDRTTTLNTIFPRSLKGRSVLDIGAAVGNTCFEAERLGAINVTGIEKNPNWFKLALLYKDIKNSSVTFLNYDIVYLIEKNILKHLRHIDYVIALNLLHHIPAEKLNKVLEFCIEKADKFFILESPMKLPKSNTTLNQIVQHLSEYYKKYLKEVKWINSELKNNRKIVIFHKRIISLL